MPISARMSLCCLLGLLAWSQTGCNMVPHQTLRLSQLRAQQLYAQNKSLAMEAGQASQRAQQLESQLSIANQRIGNLKQEREHYISLHGRNPLSDSLTRRFQALADRYPDFEFDPETGVSKFHSDILFSSGSDHLKTSAHPLLQEFAEIMNEGDARRLNILVVGHTDDQRIAKNATKAKHATNWHLSTNRANSVALSLGKFGIGQDRMGVAGYSMYQPLVANKDDESRQRNRRVEIFVLAPDAAVAGWESGGLRE